MILQSICLVIGLSFFARAAHGQGTIIYDQQSTTDESYPFSGLPIQFYGTVGQSFTPTLSSVDFVRLKVGDLTLGNGLGATLAVNLRANAINGPVLGTTTPITFADNFRGLADFVFANSIALAPNTTYFFEGIVQSGDNWGITIRSDSQGDLNYPGGVAYGGLTPFPGNDLWFREGIVVPEPSSAVLLLGGGVAVWLFRTQRRGCQATWWPRNSVPSSFD